ncbi:exosome complex component RRP45A [Selaginella moellendorffii]|uniref:exosome complex component RRP45A n=1 Tax=Selaginella moellendorffii TaxID=88036 RepID=UPI000D1CDB31|nr:exosome complex component RRP45A [Selaginella moellendorffii]|eukprot:XP_002962048.2 exosome complex component RRP45A [Selaginella moellendorffii]
MAGSVRISINEREFVESALRQELRVDGRAPFDSRRSLINFAREDGAVEVQQGETRVLAVVSAQLGTPYPDRPNEGSLVINTEFSPMADPSFEPGRPGELAVELGRVIDRGLRESRAVDTESLCVLAGKAVWFLRIDIHILDNGGNLIDVANLAALAGLLSFRRPECSIGGADGQDITIHPPEVREPLPLTLHHLPIAVTFGFLADGELVVLDPSLKEEAVMGGRLTVTVNAHGEVCAIQKGGGVAVRMNEILRCMRIAASKAAETAALLKKGAESHEIERAQRKVRRHRPSEDSKTAQVVADTVPQLNTGPQLNEFTSTGSLKLEAEATPMESDTDSEEEEPDAKEDTARKEEGRLFQGGASTWSLQSARPLDAEALDEFDLAVKKSVKVETQPGGIQGLVSAASVYQALPPQQQDRQLGPVFSTEKNTDVEMVEVAAHKEAKLEPTSLLDAVKKKPKRKRKKNQGQ